MNSLSSSFLSDIRRGESQRLELKEHSQPAEVARVVVGFLNTQGGVLVVGVTNEGEVVGISDARKLKEAIEQHLKRNVAPAASWSVTEESIEGKSCLVIDVPPGSHYPYVTENTIYIRRGQSTVKATPQDLMKLFVRGQQVSDRWERQPAIGWSLDDLDARELRRTRDVLEQRGDTIENLGNTLSLLARLQVSDEGQLLNSAIITFAQRPQKRMPQTRVRTAVLLDDLGENMRDSLLLEGNAFSLLEQILDFLKRNLPTQSSMYGMVREDRSILPSFVLREAILNALIHRDYSSFNSNILITLFADRLEIWNPGSLPRDLSPKTISLGHVSLPRNPDIAHVFYVRGLVERLGLGARRIVEECKNAGLPAPMWQEVAGGVRLVIPFSREGIRRPGSVRHTDATLNLRAISLLESLPAGSTIDLAEYQRRFAPDVSERTARRDLDALVEFRHLRVKGKDRGRVYVRLDPTENK